MWREAVYREREAVDRERETVKDLLKREQEARDKERTAKWAAIKRELHVVHQHREECQKREAAEQRVMRLQRMLRDANTQLLTAANRLSMRGILGTITTIHAYIPCPPRAAYLVIPWLRIPPCLRATAVVLVGAFCRCCSPALLQCVVKQDPSCEFSLLQLHTPQACTSTQDAPGTHLPLQRRRLPSLRLTPVATI